MIHAVLLCQTIEDVSAGLGSEPRALQAVNSARTIDLWWRALLSSRVCSTENVTIATVATHYKAYEQWAFSHGLGVGQVVNSGQSLGSCTLELRTVTAIVEHTVRAAAKPAGSESCFLIISADAVPPPDAAAQLQALVGDRARSAALAYLPTAKGHPLHVAPFAAVCDGFAADGSLPLQCITRTADSAAALASSTAAGGAGKGTPASGGAGKISTGPELWPLPGTYFLSAADAALLAEPALHAALRRAVATVASDAAPPSWPPTLSVPVEVGLSWLAALGRIAALPLSAAPPPTAVPAPHSSACGVLPVPAGAVRTVGYARVGLLGNPSDGYGGKTLSVTVSQPRDRSCWRTEQNSECCSSYTSTRLALLDAPSQSPCICLAHSGCFGCCSASEFLPCVQIANFAAECVLEPNADHSDSSIRLQPHPLYDPLAFSNLAQLSTLARRDGYSGASLVLVLAAQCACSSVSTISTASAITCVVSSPRRCGSVQAACDS